MAIKNLHDLMIHELKDIYSAEKQLTKALPKMAKAATSTELKAAFTKHLKETETQITRLERIFEMLDASPRGSKCDAMEGLIKEAEKMLKEDAPPAVLDAGLIAAAQRVEHYELAAYGCAKAFAEEMNHRETVKLLDETLEEEAAANETLTSVAQDGVNSEANVDHPEHVEA
jgi:ferritin-like metal-binding protein YciE